MRLSHFLSWLVSIYSGGMLTCTLLFVQLHAQTPSSLSLVTALPFGGEALMATTQKEPWGVLGRQWRHRITLITKELHALFLTLKTFAADARNIHVRLHVDNYTAVSYINHMGGRKRLLNDLTRDIWPTIAGYG